MESTSVRPALAKAVWHDRFGTRRMWLTPGMNAVVAAELAVAAYPSAAMLEPEEAAEFYVQWVGSAERLSL